MRFEPKTMGLEVVVHNHYIALYDPRSLTDKLTLLFELRQDRRIPSHFLTKMSSLGWVRASKWASLTTPIGCLQKEELRK